MNDYIFTFGSDQLSEFNVRPMNTLLCVRAHTETDARERVFAFDGIGSNFCTSYERKDLPFLFTGANYIQTTLKELNNVRINNN